MARAGEAGAEFAAGHPITQKPTHRWVIACWVVVLGLIGVVQVMRQQWFDTGLFFSAAMITALGPLFPGRTVIQGPLRAATAVGVVAIGTVMSLLPRHSAWMMGVMLVVGVGAVVYAWPSKSLARAGMLGRSARHPPQNQGAQTTAREVRPRRWTVGLRQLGILWAAIFLAGCLWELSQFILGYLAPDQPSYALSDLVNPLLGSLPGQAAFVAAWLAGGVFLLRRGAVPELRTGGGDP